MKYKKTNKWVRYVFTPSIAVVSAAAMLSGVVTPVAQAQTAPHQGSGNRDDGTLITEEHPWFSTFGANFEWADSRYKLAATGTDTKVNGWPLILGPNADTAGANPVDRYDSLKGTGKDFSLELQQPEKIYAFGQPPGKPNAEYFSPAVQDGDGSGISIAARSDGPFQRLHENCFLAEGNDEGIDYATQGLAGQILHCKVTDANRAIVKVVFNPNPANPGESAQPVWNPVVKLSQAVTGEVGYATDFEYRVKTIDGVPAVDSGRTFGRFGSAINAGRLGAYITDKGVEIRRTRESITSVNGNMETPEWKQSNGTVGGGVSISGAVSTMEIELLPTVYIYDDPQVRQGGADITPGEDPVPPSSTHGFDIELPSSDLGVAKTGPAVAGLGETISWKVTVTKNGSATGPSHGYVVAD
ncbi:hypothetical protein, partial [Corynebacterium sp. HS2168-gen11]|uniref:hypothetical protein n=1 Tax=Corynebacterium sp. HS2168-gen11 TaxID=2974027 RepID=UPI00216B0270